jgi:hypothetical protein
MSLQEEADALEAFKKIESSTGKSNKSVPKLSKACTEYLTKSAEYADKAVTKCRVMHAEAIEPLLMQIKCLLKLEKMQEMEGRMNYMFDLV